MVESFKLKNHFQRKSNNEMKDTKRHRQGKIFHTVKKKRVGKRKITSKKKKLF